ncbi:MAG: AraC family transcriptional regulator [Pseudonocardiales bacterium]|nr:MAG: AraC family transcriptional regulator [Pseudonocardiales bacterium]
MDRVLSTAKVVNEGARRRPDERVLTAVLDYHAYRQRGVAPALHRGLPSPYLTLIFTVDEPLEIAQHVDRRRSGGRYDTLAGGLHTTPAIIKHDGAQSGIQLLVDPLAARALFGLPAGELAGYDGDANEVLGPAAVEVHDQLREATSWTDRFMILDQVLRRILDDQRDTVGGSPAAVVHAWQLLLASGGRASVRALANAVGYSERHLANQFRTELGLSPKTAARVIRFDRARRALSGPTSSGVPARIGEVAARHGYYDQSHLVRDFIDFAGCPPSTWLAEEFGNVQAARVVEAADWPA